MERGVWHGCQTRNDGRGRLGQGWPFVTTLGTAPERGKLSEAKPVCRARFLFGYFLFRAAKRNGAKRSNSRRLTRRVSEANQVTRRKGEKHRAGWRICCEAPWWTSFALSTLLARRKGETSS